MSKTNNQDTTEQLLDMGVCLQWQQKHDPEVVGEIYLDFTIINDNIKCNVRNCDGKDDSEYDLYIPNDHKLLKNLIMGYIKANYGGCYVYEISMEFSSKKHDILLKDYGQTDKKPALLDELLNIMPSQILQKNGQIDIERLDTMISLFGVIRG